MRLDALAGAAGVGLRFIVDLEAGKPTAPIGKPLVVLQALGCTIEINPPVHELKSPLTFRRSRIY